MARFTFNDCLITGKFPDASIDLPIRVQATLTGTSTARRIGFGQTDFTCEAPVIDNRCVAWLPAPGRYTVFYRVLNNFCRGMAEFEIADSCTIEIPYHPPFMTVQVSSVPSMFQGGMIYLRSECGYRGRTVRSFGEFRFDFEYEPDLFLDAYNILGLVVRAEEYQFPICVVRNSILALDFNDATVVPFVN